MILNLSWDICIFPIIFYFCRMKAIHKFSVSGKNMYVYFSVGFELPVQTPSSTFLVQFLALDHDCSFLLIQTPGAAVAAPVLGP